jgi:arylformamidase
MLGSRPGELTAGEGMSEDRAELDANYNLRAAVPEFQDWFDRYDRMSAELRARMPGRPDLRYGASERQAIDLFLPDAPDPPLLVFIHGGYWHSQDRKRFAFVAGPLVEAGAAVALLGYDLAPAVRVEQIVEQMRQGLAWLYHHGPELGVDRERLVIAGHSAGGHLAAMALATEWSARGLPAGLIKGVCPISGIFDLEPIRRCYLNDVLAMDEAEAARNSPIHLAPQTRCPVVVAVGGDETPAFREQSRRYAERLAGHGVAGELMVRPGLDHFSIIAALGSGDDPTTAALSRLMKLA